MSKRKIPKIIPRGKQILVQPDEAPLIEKEEGGANRPVNEKEEPKAYGTVIAVGPEVKDPKMKKGARIIFAALAGDQINLEQEKVEFRLLHDEEVLAFLE